MTDKEENQLQNAKRHAWLPADEIGYLTVTIEYESIDRMQKRAKIQFFRVRKGYDIETDQIELRSGPLMPKRSIMRASVQHDLDSIVDEIEQIEAACNEIT